jgi:hypothetical protein
MKHWSLNIRHYFIILVCALVIAQPAAAQYVAQDPTRYVPNARILGLGKAFIGLSDDIGSIFTNPAGLSGLKSWELSSMSGTFLDEYSYLSFSGAYLTELGTFGLGFSGTFISGAWATTVEANSDPDDPIYTIDPSQPQMGNSNQAMILSYANQAAKVNFLNRLPYADRLSLGANLKLFNTRLYGDAINGGDASGTELDLGLKFQPPQDWLSFGAAVQNILPFSMGGKLSYASGHEESYPAVLEVGSAVKVLGKEKALRSIGDHELTLAIDFDMHPTLTSYPMCWHLGAEWSPIPLIALRTGIDQDAAGDGAGGLTTVSDSTFGVGVNFGGFTFDYAYHAFASAPNVQNSFFSLSYKHQPKPIPKEALKLDLPPDKLITFDNITKVSGTVLDYRTKKLEINRAPLRFGLKGEFETTFNLVEGKNKIVVEALDDRNKQLGFKRARILRLKPFPDVLPGYWVRQPISLLAMQGIITGYPNGTFKPEGNITRAEMATLLMKTRAQARTLGSDTAEAKTVEFTPIFTDVPGDHWAAEFVNEAAKLGVVKGYPDDTFRLKNNITRAEGLAMIARFAGVAEATWTGQFMDVAGAYWAAPIIAGAYNAGMLEYLKGKPFEPKKMLTRAETVEMLYRTLYVKDLLAKDLLNWETY